MQDGNAPLHLIGTNVDLMTSLAAAGADVNIASRDGDTPLLCVSFILDDQN